MDKPYNITAIVLAAGRGLRAGGPGPKQWQPLMGKPLISWSIAPFLTHSMVSQVVVVHHADEDDLGINRDDSVRCALTAIQPLSPDYVLIHDAARPCLDQYLLSECINFMLTHGAAAPAVAVQDTLWRGTDQVLDMIDRTQIFRAQTPQCFAYELISSAHKSAEFSATDDVQIARTAGHTVVIVPGNEDNIKVTMALMYIDLDREPRLPFAASTCPIRLG